MDARLFFALALLSALAAALPQFGSETNYFPDVPHSPEEGSIAVFLTPDLAGLRKEAYLGETLWLAIQIRNAYSPCPISIVVRDAATGEVVFQRSATLNICGGQMLPGMYYTVVIPSFRIVEPVTEGRRYKIEVRVGAEYGAYTFVERHNPVGTITALTVYSGGKPVGRLRAGEIHEVRVRVRNNGEIDYKFKVRLYVNGALRNVTEVFVLTRREGEAVLRFRPEEAGTANITVAVGGVVDTDVQSVSMDVVYPTPKFVLVEPSVIESVAGGEARGELKLKNYGEVCKSAKVESAGVVEVSNSPADVPTGGVLSVAYVLRSGAAAAGNFTLYVKCGGYTDVVRVPYRIYAIIQVAARDQLGRPVQAAPKIDGVQTASFKAPPGSHTVEVPPVVEIGPGVRYAFVRWSDGVTSPTRVVTAGPSQQLVAEYVLQYRVVLWALGQRVFDDWVPEGGEVQPPLQEYVPLNQTHRLAFAGWTGPCPQSLKFKATAPLECTAVYRHEYYVVVEDPLGKYGAAGWYANLTVSVPTEVADSDVRYKFAGTNCPYDVQGAVAKIKAAGAARCQLRWSKEYKVIISPGLEAEPWEGWVPEGSKIRYTVGEVLKADATGLTVPPQVVRGFVRYVPAGWTCGGDEVAVNAPLRCAAQWKRQLLVKVQVVLDGQVQKEQDVWLDEGAKALLDSENYRPQAPPLTMVNFDGWNLNNTHISGRLLEVAPPALVQAVYKTFPLTPVVIAAAGIAVAAVVVIRRIRRPKVELEELGEETRTR